MTTTDEYALGRSEAETQRLIMQAHIYGPITRRFFQAAGIGPGMKVLDLGSGAGDVALLAADLVGPRGQVVGVDMNAAILDTARARAATIGWRNVTFRGGDVRELGLDSDFDAVVGRWILMHLPDPTEMLRFVATRLRPGGIVAFHENDFTYPPSFIPETEAWRELFKWMMPPPGAPGPEMRMGTKLFKIYQDAGLPEPQLIVEAAAGGGESWPGYEYVVATFRSLLPRLQHVTGVDPSSIDLDSLVRRLREENVRQRGIHMLPIMFGAWTRVP